MQRTPRPTFRPTLWPGPLGRSTATRTELATPVADLATQTGRSEMVELPADYSIRETLVPSAGDLGAVLGFMREWGLLCRAGRSGLHSLPQMEGEHLEGVVREDRERATAAGMPPNMQAISVSLPLAARHLEILQAAARHVIAYLEEDKTAVLAAWTGLGFANAPATARETWHTLQTYITTALRPFQAHLRIEDDDPHASALLPDPTTYELAMLQLAEIVSGQSGPLPRCANDRCGLPFVRQRGRSKYDGTQHTTGVRYCSHLCAKAQSERDRRRRRKSGTA